MKLDFGTMLDIALGGPEIGPLNLHVLHTLMREVFQRIDLSKQNIIIDEENPEFFDSYNFIESKLEKIPRTAGGGYRKLKSKVSVIVSDYVRMPIGEQSQESEVLDEDKLKYIGSNVTKDFPTVDELRNWAKENSTSDTVVTDAWHFVSLNHRMSGAEEGIQRLTALVDKLIPELKDVGEEGGLVRRKIDDLYSPLKSLSDRMTYIDNKIDNASQRIAEQMESIEASVKNIEEEMKANYTEFVHLDLYREAAEIARRSVNEIREELAGKVDISQMDSLASQSDLKNRDNAINYIEFKLGAHVKELNNFVSNDVYLESEERIKASIDVINDDVRHKVDSSMIDRLNDEIIGKLTEIVGHVGQLTDQQDTLKNELKITQQQVREKADNVDVVAMAAKADLNQNVINEVESWQSRFEKEEKPFLKSKFREMEIEACKFNESLSILKDEESKKPSKSFEELLHEVNEHNKTCQDNTSHIFAQLEEKLNKNEIQPLKEYLENCYNTLSQQHLLNNQVQQTNQEVNEIPEGDNQRNNKTLNGFHQDSPPLNNSKSPINQSQILPDISHPMYASGFEPYRDDAAIVRTKMKLNCLSCDRPLSIQSNKYVQTSRGKALNAYELENMKLLQKMDDHGDIYKDKRPCGGRHTTVINNSAKPFLKSSAVISTHYNNLFTDKEVDLEGLDGRLYRGLVAKNNSFNIRCTSADVHPSKAEY